MSKRGWILLLAVAGCVAFWAALILTVSPRRYS